MEKVAPGLHLLLMVHGANEEDFDFGKRAHEFALVNGPARLRVVPSVRLVHFHVHADVFASEKLLLTVVLDLDTVALRTYHNISSRQRCY